MAEKAGQRKGGGAEAEGDQTSLETQVEFMLKQMDEQFKRMSDQIILRLDEMGKRVGDLEKNIRDLMEQVDTKEDTTGTDPTSRK